MRLPGRARFGDVISRQLAMFMTDQHDLLLAVEQARVSYTHARAGDAEELYGDYMDLVEQAEEELLALRDRYAETMAGRDRSRTGWEAVGRPFTPVGKGRAPAPILTARGARIPMGALLRVPSFGLCRASRLSVLRVLVITASTLLVIL